MDESGAKKFQGGVIVIGNFDGLHLGHQALLGAAAEHPSPRIVITFDPHPVQVLRPEQGLTRLFPRQDLEERLPDYGVDLLMILPFTREFAQLGPDEFLNSYLKPFAPKLVVAGYDFAFGKDRKGSHERLRAWAQENKARLKTVPALEQGGAIVSSRRLRELVQQGLVAQARTLLGRPFYLRGPVVAGAGRGVKLGFPTLNQSVQNETLPAIGVYATTTVWRKKRYPSISNIGWNPTFGDAVKVKVETHILSGPIKVGGESIDVELVDYIRPEKKFGSPAELVEQIALDIAKARELLGLL